MRYTIADCVAANARAFPDRVAIEVLDPRNGAGTAPVATLTFAEVWRRVVGLAEALGTVAPGPNGSMVAILLPQSSDAALAYLACQVAGAAAVPVNTRLAPAEIAYVLTDSGASVLLAAGELLDVARSVAADVGGVRVVDTDAVVTPEVAPWPGPAGVGTSDDMAVIGYTSGTTGFPKGTWWTNDGWMTRLLQWSATFGLSPDRVLSTPGPIFHLSYGGLTLAALVVGARTRIMAAFEPAVAAEEYAEHSDFVFLVPSMLAMIADWWRANGRPPLGALRVMLSSGAPGPMSLLEEAFEVFPNASITEAYGWTEGGWVTYETKVRGALVPHSVGWPMLGSEVEVLDDDGRPCPVGVAGEVVSRSVVPFLGYLNKAEASAANVTPEGFTRSGDVGIWLADGRLSIVDRVKDMIISGGENIYCAEVERILIEHPDVAEAAVVGLPDATWGERVTALVVARPGVALDEAGVIAFCRERLAAYKCPKSVVFAPELPRNSMGKVQKFRIVEELADGR